MTGISNSMTRIVTEHPIVSTTIGSGLGAIAIAALSTSEFAKAVTLKTTHATLNVLSQISFAISAPVAGFVGRAALVGFLAGNRDPRLKTAAKVAVIFTLLSVASGALLGAERFFYLDEGITTRQQVVHGATLGAVMPVATGAFFTVIFDCIAKCRGPANPTT